jgi:hypothetical protein
VRIVLAQEPNDLIQLSPALVIVQGLEVGIELIHCALNVPWVKMDLKWPK